jgi:hypothetical protein
MRKAGDGNRVVYEPMRSADTSQHTPLSALLPLKVSGRHYRDNLTRVDLLFSSLLHFGGPGLLDELLVVARADEAELIAGHLSHWPELPLRIVIEDDHFPVFQRFTRPWQVRPWQRQQIIKLNASAFTSAPFVLMLDPDVLAVKPLTHDMVISGGRAILEPEARRVHRQWWLDSAALLGVEPGLDRQGINVTPEVLSTAVLERLHRQLEDVNGRGWMETLLTSYCDWTEYTLYLLAAEHAGLLERYHIWADDPEAPAHLQVAPTVSVWDAVRASRETVERLFNADDPGLFAIVQGAINSGVTASDIAAVLSKQLEVRIIPEQPLPDAEGRTKLEERLCAASRRVAQRLYRIHRHLRARSDRGRRGLEVRANEAHS